MLRLPALATPRVRQRARVPAATGLRQLDALLVMADSTGSKFWPALPEAARWRALHARQAPRHGDVRSTTLGNAGQTLAVLGYRPASASVFELLELAGRMVRALGERRPARVAIWIEGQDAAGGEAVLRALLSQSFALPAFRRPLAPPWQLKAIELWGMKLPALPRLLATARAGNLTRWLTALPPNLLDARGYRRILEQLAKAHGLKLHWYSQAALRALGAGAFLAVARGSATPHAGIARLSYEGRARGEVDLALVGKGILFDTGGTNLKPHKYMLDMHTDMSGSAVALATLIALAELRAPLRAQAWLAVADNAIGPNAYRPQEIVRALNGTTIQVIHTDAEGRMVLADTLALAARARPRRIIDFATLTGACVYALTERYSGVFTNRAPLGPQLVQAGARSGERVWHFPLDEDFDRDLDSKIADVLQCATEGKGDHILAARFLQRFVPAAIEWIHVDLASAVRSGGLGAVSTDITGFGPAFALELLLGTKPDARRRRP